MKDLPSDIKREIYRGMCRPIPPMDEWRTLMMCSEKGSGKTYQMGRFIASLPVDIPVCIISFRKALGLEQMARYDLRKYGFKHYQDEGWLGHHRVVTTVESLHKWSMPEGTLVIIDEYEGMLS